MIASSPLISLQMHAQEMASPPYLHSQPSSRYGSPAPSQWSGDAYPGQQAGIIGYGPYGSPVPLHSQPHPYGSPPFAPAMRDSSTPPTSSHSQDGSTAGRKTRRSTPAKRKAKTGGKGSTEVPNLVAPLSELTKDMNDVPLRDMKVWVNRSVEDRLSEAAERQGKIARPMNSFMLYRSAYANRTKKWCEQNNHQVVSAVSGKSWPMEPTEVRDMYHELARIERDNHQKAHPGYKFSPSKNGPQPPRKRKDLSEDDDEDGAFVLSDHDADPDYRPSGSGNSGGNKRRPRPANGTTNGQRAATPDMSSYSPYSGFGDAMAGPYPLHNSPEVMLDHAYGGYGEYYHPIHGNAGGINAVDVQDGRLVHAPHMTFGHEQYHHHHHHQQQQLLQQHQPPPQHSVVGLPGTGDFDLMDEHALTGAHTPAGFDPAQLDPMLMGGYQPNFTGQGGMMENAAFSEQGFRELDEEMLATLMPGVQVAPDAVAQPWEQQHPRSEVEADFERIMRASVKNE